MVRARLIVMPLLVASVCALGSTEHALARPDGAATGSEPATATARRPYEQTFVESRVAFGAPATSLDVSSARDEGSQLVVGQPGGLAVLPFDDRIRATQTGRVGLDRGTDVSSVLEIQPSAGADDHAVPWAGDLLVSDRAGARLIRLHREGAEWRMAGTLPTSSAPVSLFELFDHSVLRGWRAGVADSGSNTISLFGVRGNTWQATGHISVGEHPVAAERFALPNDQEAVGVVNAGSDSLSILSGRSLSRRRDIPVGHAPSAFAAWDEGPVMLAVANSGSASVSVVVLRYGRSAMVKTVPLPGTRPVAVALDRFDRDGRADLAVADGAGHRLFVLHGAGAGRFVLGTVIDLPDEPIAMLGPEDAYDIAVVGRNGVLSALRAVDDRKLAAHGVGVAAGRGRVLWSTRSSRRYRLIERRGGSAQRLRGVGASRRPIRARFGRGPHGQLSVAYLRCDRRSCTPFRYDFARAREVRLRSIRTPKGCRLTDVATWRGRVAYVFDHKSRGRSCRRDAVGVWLRAGGRVRRLGQGFRSRLGSLTGRFLGWSQWRGSDWNARATIRLADSRTGRARTLHRGNWRNYDLGFELTGPFVDGNSLYWASVGTSSISVDETVELYRQVGLGRARCRRRVTHTGDSRLGIPSNWDEGPLVDFAVDHGRIFYVTDNTPTAADMTRLRSRLACAPRG